MPPTDDVSDVLAHVVCPGVNQSTPTSPADVPGDAPDPHERLSADDLATQREAQFLAQALTVQQQAAKATRSNPGRCANCGTACLPLAVYCDDECRADHEHRQSILRRQGRA